MKTRSTAAGFTLLELLTVIGIVALLAAIAFPVVSSFRKKGDEAGCLGNARQLANAMLNYANEYNGAINGMGQVDEGNGTRSNWMTRMRPYYQAETYAEVREEFICKSHPEFVQDNESHVGWALNTQIAPVNYALKTMVQIPDPINTIYAAEGYRDFDWDSGDAHKANFTMPKAFAKKNVMPAGERVFFPHEGRGAFVFLDGRAEMLSAPIERNLWVVEK